MVCSYGDKAKSVGFLVQLSASVIVTCTSCCSGEPVIDGGMSSSRRENSELLEKTAT